MAAPREAVAIAFAPTYMDKAVKEILGLSIRSKKVVVTTKAQDTLIAKNVRAATQSFFNEFGLHIQGKVVLAFQKQRDPSTGKKWKALSREAVAKRGELQNQYARQFADKGFRGRMKKVEFMPPNVKPLYLTGKLFKVATGSNLKNLSGGMGKQTSGSLKDGIKLTIYAGYKPNQPIQFGSYFWYIDGDKVRHNYGYDAYFKNVLSDGTEVEPQKFAVPARPFMPKFSNQFLSSFIKSRVEKKYRSAFIATEKGSQALFNDAVNNLARAGRGF
jgi:hypothetical protein